MSLLMPLFLAGLATLALPILLHLVRRTPRGRFEFSSLMFLDPVPPQLTRRSRLEHWLLLALRLAALGLLTLAFARPFLREAAPLALASLPARRVALLLDTSASLRRPGLWEQSLAAARHELGQLGPQDRIGLYTFGDTLTTVVGVDAPLTPGQQHAAVAAALAGLQPGWSGTDLGRALVEVADCLVTSAEDTQTDAAGQIVVIGDLARGTRLEALDQSPWPAGVSVTLRPPADPPPGNAQLQLLANPVGEATPGWRVRVTNSAESTSSEWRLAWRAGDGQASDAARSAQQVISVTVPPGESRVIRIEPGERRPDAAQLELLDDPVDFDNRWYVAPPPRRVTTVLHDGPGGSQGVNDLAWYLRLAGAAEEHREVLVEPFSAARLTSNDPAGVAVLVLTGEPGESPLETGAILDWVERGGVVWGTAAGTEPPEWLARLFPEIEPQGGLREPAGGFALLADLDFSHPWFAPFATPPHGDFTGIHFWKVAPWRLREAASPGAPATPDAPVGTGPRPTPPPPTSGRTSADGDGAATASATAQSTRDNSPVVNRPDRKSAVAGTLVNDAAEGGLPATPLRVLARFDSGDPAWVERRVGAGRLFALAGSWRPADSQLALSGKFVVLISRLLDLALGLEEDAGGLRVGQPWSIPTRLRETGGEIVTPAGTRCPIAPGQLSFDLTEIPGLYTARLAREEIVFAVNLDPTEGQTSPLDPDLLARRGVPLSAGQTAAARLERLRQERDMELEGRQKLWRWLMLATLLLVVAETITGLRCEPNLNRPGTTP